MIKTLLSLMLLGFAINSQAQMDQSEAACDAIWVNMAQTQIDIQNGTNTEDKQVLAKELHVCNTKDLSPGSFNIDRLIKVCGVALKPNDRAAYKIEVTLKTNGNYFCENERLVSVKGIVVK